MRRAILVSQRRGSGSLPLLALFEPEAISNLSLPYGGWRTCLKLPHERAIYEYMRWFDISCSVIARSTCDEAIQSFLVAFWIASL